MSLPILVVDAFTDHPFGGNPAAVCLLGEERPDDWLQAVAAEMNLSETAFLRPVAPGAWRLRWFTPVREVDLCGHATLASAHALRHGWGEAAERLRFQTRSGELVAGFDGDVIIIDLPADPPRPVDAALLAGVLDGAPLYVGRSRSGNHLLAQLASADEVRACRPDLQRLAQLDALGLIVTARGDGGFDVVSRYFAPAAGIAEDPVTGAAHTCLAPFWAGLLGRGEFDAWQASARGGALRVRLDGERVLLGGRAVTTLEGQLRV
jgi:predicted PhzF superfamily epimerase YddE/YHI9